VGNLEEVDLAGEHMVAFAEGTQLVEAHMVLPCVVVVLAGNLIEERK
jgi:hypothetical protein